MRPQGCLTKITIKCLHAVWFKWDDIKILRKAMGHLISNFWNVWDSKPWTIIFVVKTYQAITYHSMNKYIYNTDLNCTSLKPTQVHLLYLYSILAGKIFGTVNGTLISKYEDYFWDIDIKNMTVSHLGHIGCITGLLMYLARKWPQNTCFRSKT